METSLRDHIGKVVSLTDDEFEFVLSYFTRKNFRKHQIIVHQGDYAKYDYFVLKGLIRSSHVDQDGKEHIIQFALENGWITDQQAFHNQTAATLTVDCLEDATVLAISLEDRRALCRDLQKMERFFAQQATTGYIDLQRRVLCLISSTASKRYHYLIAQSPDLLRRVPKAMIASYLGVSRETLSRLTPVL